MQRYVWVLCLVLLMGFTPSPENNIRIFIAGDSTAQTYNERRDGLIKGWGQMLALFLNEKVEVVNHAIGGRSTNSFIAEGRWNRLIAEVKTGDYVLSSSAITMLPPVRNDIHPTKNMSRIWCV